MSLARLKIASVFVIWLSALKIYVLDFPPTMINTMHSE